MLFKQAQNTLTSACPSLQPTALFTQNPYETLGPASYGGFVRFELRGPSFGKTHDGNLRVTIEGSQTNHRVVAQLLVSQEYAEMLF